MMRLWWIVRYFVKFPENGYWANRNDSIDRTKFIFYILQDKLFRKGLRDTFWDWYIKYIRKYHDRESNPVIVGRMTKRLEKINLDIDRAKAKGYLIVRGQPSHSEELTIDWRGHDFLRPLPFVEACLKEYGQTLTVILAILGSGLAWAVVVHWHKIWELVGGLIG